MDDLKAQIDKAVMDAYKRIQFEPADGAIYTFRSMVANYLNSLTVAKKITGYRIDVKMDDGSIKGSITYSPVRYVKEVNIRLVNTGEENFSRAMKGI